MDSELVLPKSVKRVTFVRLAGASDRGPAPYEAFRGGGKKKKKKQTAGLKVLGKWAFRSGKVAQEMADTYLERHAKSNRKSRDGWMRDFGFNLMRANRSGMKKMRLPVFRF